MGVLLISITGGAPPGITRARQINVLVKTTMEKLARNRALPSMQTMFVAMAKFGHASMDAGFTLRTNVTKKQTKTNSLGD